MKRVRVRNNFIVYSLFDFSEIILARYLTLSLSLHKFYWGGEMPLIYVLQLLNKLYEVLETSLQFSQINNHSKPVRYGGLYIVIYPTGFT